MPAIHLEYPKLISQSSYLNSFIVYLFINFLVLLSHLPCLLNSLGQPKYERNGHLNLFTVWWISTCLTSLSLRLNALGQCWVGKKKKKKSKTNTHHKNNGFFKYYKTKIPCVRCHPSLHQIGSQISVWDEYIFNKLNTMLTLTNKKFMQ